MVKNPPAMQETWVQSLGWEDSPGGGHGNPLKYFCLENPRGLYSPRGPKSQTRLIEEAQHSSNEYSASSKRKPYLLSMAQFLFGLPGWFNGKEPACQCRRHKRHRFDPWVGKIPLEEGMATHSSILAWRISWMEEPSRLQFIGSRRVRHDWSDLAH